MPKTSPFLQPERTGVSLYVRLTEQDSRAAFGDITRLSHAMKEMFYVQSTIL